MSRDESRGESRVESEGVSRGEIGVESTGMKMLYVMLRSKARFER
jgi:hypothetical protein